MANWAYIENNKIVELHDRLPKSWKRVSGLDKASIPHLRTLGWLPVEANYQSFNSNTHKTEGYTYQILPTKVVESLKLVALTTAEITEQSSSVRNNFFERLRQERDTLLAKSDWTQMADVQEANIGSWRNSWKVYRQELRDLPAKYQNTTNFDYSKVVWPRIPQ